MAEKVAFVDLSNNFNDKHAVYMLSAYLRRSGIETGYIKEPTAPRAIRRIKELKPALLLYSAFSMELPLFTEFDRAVKEQLRVKSIIGGPGPTFDWGVIERSTIDAACIGEGEYALEEYIKGGFKQAKNIIFRGQEMPSGYHPFADLDSLPFPDRDQVYRQDSLLRAIGAKQFFSGKGCPYTCAYCFNNAYNAMFKGCGKIIRKKSVDYLIEEINQVRSRYPLSAAVFQDDTFIAEREWFFEFSDKFPRRVGIPYTCSIRANLVDEGLVKALKESGCIKAWWSIESGNDHIRNKLLKRNISREQILETGMLLRKYGIPYRMGNMIGLPGEKYENMLETLKLNVEVGSPLALANIYIPYPSLELTEYAIRNNYLRPEAMQNMPKNFFRKSILNFTAGEKAKMLRLSYLFPLMAKHPFFYQHALARRLLFALPLVLARIIYDISFVLNMRWMYHCRQSPKEYALMLWRYLKDI